MANAGDKFEKLINNAIQTAYHENLLKQVCDYADKLVEYSIDNRTFISFTGNTLSSFGCGVYWYGKLVYSSMAISSLGLPLTKKLSYGSKLYLANPDEGSPRSAIGRFDVTDEYGFETTERLLKNWSAPAKSAISLYMTTGTEYSQYIENERGMDVLQMTVDEVWDTFISSIKPIVK